MPIDPPVLPLRRRATAAFALLLVPLVALAAGCATAGTAPSAPATATPAPATATPAGAPLDRSADALRADLVAALAKAPGNSALVAAGLVATLWQQRSAERDAGYLQGYAAATRALDAGLADPAWTAALEQAGQPAQALAGLPPAVVLDLDETVLDNAAESAREILWQRPFNEEDWALWVRGGGVEPNAGAAAFLAHAVERGVDVFYVTNYVPKLAPVITERLRALGLPVAPGRVLAKDPERGWGSDKTSRRAAVAKSHRILVLVGDDLGDFVSIDGKTMAERDALVAAAADRWGSRWILLPNPVYGSWSMALFAPDKPWTLSPEERLRRLVALLDPGLPVPAVALPAAGVPPAP